MPHWNICNKMASYYFQKVASIFTGLHLDSFTNKLFLGEGCLLFLGRSCPFGLAQSFFPRGKEDCLTNPKSICVEGQGEVSFSDFHCHCIQIYTSGEAESYLVIVTQVYKWVPANLMLGVILQWTSIQSRGDGVEISPVASCCRQ